MEGMSVIVKTVTRWVMGFVLVYGLATVLYGHLTPGGGFAGGVIIACGFVLWVLAYGGRGRHGTAHKVASTLDVVGLAAFLALALAGLTGGVFFLNFLGRGKAFALASGGVIPLMNLAIALKVGASVFLASLVLMALRLPEDEDGELSTLEDAE